MRKATTYVMAVLIVLITLVVPKCSERRAKKNILNIEEQFNSKEKQ